MKNNVDENNLNVSCFEAHKKFKKNCNKKNCRYWHDLGESNNCIINKSNSKPHTLQEIGDILGITRMHVCQIEKRIIKKLKDLN